MRKPAHSEEEIIAVGKALAAEGKEPNANAIKPLLGGGNAVRIRRVWEAFVAESGAQNRIQETTESKPLSDDRQIYRDVRHAEGLGARWDWLDEDFGDLSQTLLVEKFAKSVMSTFESIFSESLRDLLLAQKDQYEHEIDGLTRALELEEQETERAYSGNKMLSGMLEDAKEAQASAEEKLKAALDEIKELKAELRN